MAADERRKCNSSSEYVRTLDCKARARYIEKVKLCDGIDPNALSKNDLTYELAKYPPVQFPDISNYLVLQTSFCTAKQMKAWKSMDAYNFFVCGWVKEVGVKVLKDKSCIVKSRVKHSQCSSKTPTHTWLLIKEDGDVITAHCDCMAGLAESCSHVGAVLYALETGVRMRESVACTDEKSKWLMQTHVDKIPVAPVSRIDFASARAKKQRLDDAISCSTTEAKKKPAKSCPPVAKGSETYKKFFEELSQNCPKSAALITNEAFYKNFIPKSATTMLPKSIMDCRTEDTVSLSDGYMDELCKTFTLPALTASHISAVERETRKQAGSRIWFRQRAGRITASKLKQALHTTADKPAKSLIKAICYPESNRFSSLATRYGCQHEAQARREYEKAMAELHDGFSIAESGLHLNAKWPYMGASPDGIVNCECHGTGVCEIKCPHCYQDKENLSDCAGQKGFCLVREGDTVKLDRAHAYYYQVQAQLFILDVDYCDFIVWNQKDFVVERIVPDLAFWGNVVPRAELFFRKCLLPEILGKRFTRQVTGSLLSQNRSPLECINRRLGQQLS